MRTSGKEIAVLKGHTAFVSAAAFSADGKRVVTASGTRPRASGMRESGKEIAVLKGHTDFVSSAAFSGDGKRVVTASCRPYRANLGCGERQGDRRSN